LHHINGGTESTEHLGGGVNFRLVGRDDEVKAFLGTNTRQLVTDAG
jgi:hypothetical protein